MKSYRSSFIIAAAAALVALGFAPMTIHEPIGEIGSKVVPFELPTYDGGMFKTSQLDGKVTLLVFWFPT